MTGFGGWGQPDQSRMLDKLNWLTSSLHSEVLRLKRRFFRFEALANMSAAGVKPRLPMEFTSQFGEDLWLWELFDGKRDGFFIEAGAFDGYTLSVSYPFEAAGWSGLLVEPVPEMCELARQRRPHSTVVNAALSVVGSEGETTFHVVPSDATLSFHVPDSKHLVNVQKAGRIVEVKVRMTTLNTLLANHAGPIDFLLLDVEGAELSVLNGFDIERFKPRVMMIEDDIYKPQSRLTDYMKNFPNYVEAGYVWINRVYIRADEPELLARARRMAM